MILSVGRPKTRLPVICWPTFGSHASDERRWVESTLGAGLVDELYFRSQLPLDEYTQRQYVRLVAPFNQLAPGELRSTNFSLEPEVVRNSDVLWFADNNMGRAFSSILAVVLFELGWDVDIHKNGNLVSVVGVEETLLDRRGAVPFKKVVVE